MRLPSEIEAQQFAIMLEAGLPAHDAIVYFSDGLEASEVGLMAAKWPRSAAVRRASAALKPRKWQEMSLEEKLKDAIDYHYTTLAYVLRSNHYGEADSATKSKLDEARKAIEARLAGTAGKTTEITKFFDDLAAGRIASLGAATQRRSTALQPPAARKIN